VFVTKPQLVIVLIVILVTEIVIILITCLGLYIFNCTKFKNINTNIIVTISVSFNIITLIITDYNTVINYLHTILFRSDIQQY